MSFDPTQPVFGDCTNCPCETETCFACTKLYSVQLVFPAGGSCQPCGGGYDLAVTACETAWAADPDWSEIPCNGGANVSVTCDGTCQCAEGGAPTVGATSYIGALVVSYHIFPPCCDVFGNPCDAPGNYCGGGSGLCDTAVWQQSRGRIYGPSAAFCLGFEAVSHEGGSTEDAYVQYAAVAAGAYVEVSAPSGNPMFNDYQFCGTCPPP